MSQRLIATSLSFCAALFVSVAFMYPSGPAVFLAAFSTLVAVQWIFEATR